MRLRERSDEVQYIALLLSIDAATVQQHNGVGGCGALACSEHTIGNQCGGIFVRRMREAVAEDPRARETA